MRWVSLFFAAITAGLLVVVPHDVGFALLTFVGVFHFGLFVDGCLERHRP